MCHCSPSQCSPSISYLHISRIAAPTQASTQLWVGEFFTRKDIRRYNWRMRIQITRATQLDDELVAALARLLPQLAPDAALPSTAHLADVLANPLTHLLLARDASGEIIGMLTLVLYRTATGLHAWIEDVVVDLSARGQGIGELLCNAGIAIARDAGANHVNLTSRPTREAANRLYQRLGFVLRQTNLYRYTIRP